MNELAIKNSTPSPQCVRWLRCFLVAFLVAGGQTLFAQSGGGTLTGRVLDAASGNYLEGAEIQLEDVPALRTATERGGSFTIPDVPAGSHVVLVSYPGLETKSQAVVVTAGAPTEIQIRLSSDIVKLEAITVQGAKEGMAQAVALQKVSVQYKLVAAADQFGPVSEGNIGEYLKFLPGVSIDYNVNDARGISLRGLSSSFTIVAVDGTPMAGASSTDDTRRFEFEQIAMNNVETTELYKTVTPDIPASATGGFVNFVTKSAFDFEEQQRLTYDLSFSAPSSNAELRKVGGVWGHRKEWPIRPSLEANFARKLTPKLGLNFNYRLSEKYDDSPRTEFTWNTGTTAPTVMTAPRLQQYNIRQEEKLTHREAFASKLDYRMSDHTRLLISGQWNWYDLDFTQRGPQFNLGTASTGSNGTFTSGTGAQVQNNVLYREKYGTTFHFNGTLSHEFDNKSKLAITPYWSHADSQYRDTSKGFISTTAILAPSATTYSNFTLANVNTLGVLPSISFVQGTTPVPLDYGRNLANYTLSNTTGTNFQSRPWTAIDKKNGVRADYTLPLDLSLPVTLQTGFAFDNTDRKIRRPDIRGTVTAITGSALQALADPLYTKDVALGFGSYQSVDPYLAWSTFSTVPMTLNGYDTRDISEKNRAGYLRGDVKLRPDLLLIGGVRWEKRTIDAAAKTGSPTRSLLTQANLDYDSWYPSLNLRYTPKREIVLRGGYSRTIGHPDYVEILPAFVVPTSPTATDGTVSAPAAGLKPYHVNNYDLAADYYLKNSGVVSVSLYRKDVTDFITARSMSTAERDQYIQTYGLNPADFGVTPGTVRENGSKSRLQGMEISYAQNLTFLPRPFDGFNVQANFSRTQITTSDSDPFRALDTLYSQLRAVSPKTANFILGYRYRSFAATITTNWVSQSLYGGFVNTNYFTGSANTANPAADTRLTLNKDEKTTTDIKVEYSFSRRVSAYFLVRNVFNTARKEFLQGYLPQNRGVVLPLRYFEFGEPHLTIGVRGTF